MTDLQNMFCSLAIWTEENVLKYFLVADSLQRKSYCDAIIAEIDEILNEQETKDAKDKKENTDETEGGNETV